MCKRMKLDSSHTPSTKINSKCIKNLNLRPELIKLLEEKIYSKLLDIGLTVDFLDLTPKVKATDIKVGLIK